MKFALFLLGALTGTVFTYLFLTRVWWPDVRLEAAHVEARLLATPDPLGATATPLAEARLPVEPTATPGLLPPLEAASVELPLLKTDLITLRARALLVPVRGVDHQSLRDTFMDDRGGRRHGAIDILAPHGTPVLAVDNGRVEKLFTSRLGGVTIYQFDSQGEYCYYYAHLDRYAPGLIAGGLVRRGDVIGFVGTSGNAPPQTPHLHFAIFRLGADRHWWQGTAVNAYPLWGDLTR